MAHAGSTTSTSTCAPACRAGRCRFPTSSASSSPATVDAVGPGVEHLAVGDRVWPSTRSSAACRYCGAGRPNLCHNAKMFSVQCLGGYAEYVLAPAHATHMLPDGLTFEQAAAGQVASRPRGTCSSTAAGCSRARRSWSRPPAAASATRPSRSPRWRAPASSRPRARPQARPRARARRRRDDQLPRGLDRRAGARADRRRGRRPVHRARRRRPVDGQPGSLRPAAGWSRAGPRRGDPRVDMIEVFRNEWRVIGSRIGTPEEMQLAMKLMGEGRLTPASTRRSRCPRRRGPPDHRAPRADRKGGARPVREPEPDDYVSRYTRDVSSSRARPAWSSWT